MGLHPSTGSGWPSAHGRKALAIGVTEWVDSLNEAEINALFSDELVKRDGRLWRVLQRGNEPPDNLLNELERIKRERHRRTIVGREILL